MTEDEFQSFLDDISECFIAADFQQWADRIELPFSIVTKTGPVISYTLEELRADFDLYLQACENMGLDTVFRTPLTCEICDDGSVIATYRTELLSRGHRMTEAFTSSALLSSRDGIWRMTAILNARGHQSWTGHHPHKSGRPT